MFKNNLQLIETEGPAARAEIWGGELFVKQQERRETKETIHDEKGDK